MENAVAEYEVFKNDRNALAFFFAHQAFLDENPVEGPFWFAIEENRIRAGTAAHHAVFEGIGQDILETAKARGVILLVEFEDRQPVRATPCYFSEQL